MRFVEGVVGKIDDLVIDAARDVLRHAVRNAAGDVPHRVAVDEGDALGVDDGVLFLLIARRMTSAWPSEYPASSRNTCCTCS